MSNPGTTSSALLKAANLSDVADTPAARGNLGLGSAALLGARDLDVFRQGNPSRNPLDIPNLDLWLDAASIDKLLFGYDWFGRADSAVAVGTADDGTAWTTQSGVMGVQGNAAYMPSGVGAIASRNAGSVGAADSVQDYVITSPVAGTPMTVTLYARFSNTTNYIGVNLVNSKAGTNTCQVVSDVAGVTTQLGFNGAAGLPNSGTFTIRVVSKGNTYTVYLNPTATTNGAVLVNAAADAGNNFLVNSSIGIGFGSSDSTSRINAIAVSANPPVNADTISVWPDASQTATNGAPAQPTAASRPTYTTGAINGKAALSFAGAQVLTSAIPATDLPVTIVAVIQRSASGANHAILSSTTGGLEFRCNAANQLEVLKTNTSSIGISRDTITQGVPLIVAVTVEANGNFVFYINGQPSANNWINQALPALTGGTTVTVGATTTGADQFNGSIGEIVRYSRVLSGFELRNLTNGLAQKWGIALPSRIGRGGYTPLPYARIRGANISPAPGDYTAPPVVNDPWSKMWANWNWSGWLQPSIDGAKAAGANGIRLIGDIAALYVGAMSTAQWQARWTQAASYCQSQGLWLYPCFSDTRHLGGAPISFVTSAIVSACTALAPYKSVLAGVDLSNEIGSGYSILSHRAIVGAVAKWSAAVSRNLSGVPITASNASQAAGTNSMTAWMADYLGYSLLDPYLDFFDLHIYPTATIRSQVSDPTAFYVHNDKPLVLGEFGVDRNNFTNPTAAQVYQDIITMAVQNPAIQAVYHWDIASSNMGLLTTAFAPSSDLAPEFAQLATAL